MSSKSLDTRASQGQMAAHSSVPQSMNGQARQRGGPDASASSISPGMVLHAVKRWWTVALPVGLVLAAAAAAGVWMTFETVYRATAWVQIFNAPPEVVPPGPGGERVGDRQVATQLQLITSPMVMYGMDGVGPEGVIDKLLNGEIDGWPRSEVPDLPPDKAKDRWYLLHWLVSGISVHQEGSRGSELYTVSFSSVNPKFAKAIANAVANEYLDLTKAQTTDQNLTLIKLLDGINEKRVKSLEADRQALAELAKKLPDGGSVLGPSGVESSMSRVIASLRDRLTSAEVDLQLTEAKVALLKEATSKEAANPSDLDLESQIQADPNLRQREEEILQMENTLASIKQAAREGKDDPRYRQLDDKIQQMQKDLDAEARTRFEQSTKEWLAETEAQLQAQRLAVDYLKGRYEELRGQVQEGNQDTLELELSKSDVQRKQDVIDLIAQRINLLSANESAPSQAIPQMSAEEPTHPEREYPIKEWALAILLGLALPFAGAVGWEALVRRVSDSERLEKDLGLTIIGEIHCLPKRRRKHLAKPAVEGAKSLELFHESLDALSTNVALLDTLRDARVLAVTSAVASEGKTSVAAELAIRLSQNAEAKVLLMDGDMRSPDVHKFFDVPLEPGLVGVLQQKHTLDEAIVTGWSERLDLLPAGRLASNAVSLLGNGHLRSLLDEALKRYRFIVVDTPPVLPASESVLLSNAADATLLCAMWDVSRADQIQRANRRLLMSGIHSAGVVVNGVPARWYVRRYGAYAYPTAKSQ